MNESININEASFERPALLFFSGGELRDQIVGVGAKKAIRLKTGNLSSTTAALSLEMRLQDGGFGARERHNVTQP
jgi:hypothetical protein